MINFWVRFISICIRKYQFFRKFLHDACRKLILSIRKENKIWKCVSFTSETIFPVPEATKNKICICVHFGRFSNFPKFSESQFEIPKKRRAWDSNPRATSAVQRAYGRSVPYHSTTAALAGLRGSTSRWCAAGRLLVDTPKVSASKTWSKLIIFHQNPNRYTYRKNRHAESKCIKEHAESDDFWSKSVDL